MRLLVTQTFVTILLVLLNKYPFLQVVLRTVFLRIHVLVDAYIILSVTCRLNVQ